jgi:hypothetical protein
MTSRRKSCERKPGDARTRGVKGYTRYPNFVQRFDRISFSQRTASGDAGCTVSATRVEPRQNPPDSLWRELRRATGANQPLLRPERCTRWPSGHAKMTIPI